MNQKATVTVVLNLRVDAAELKELAKRLKRSCGAGGTVKNGVIEIQGERTDQVRTLLREEGIRAQ